MFKIFDKKTPWGNVVREVDGHRVKIELTFVNKIGEVEIYTEFLEGAGDVKEIVEKYCYNASFIRSLLLHNDRVIINNPHEQLQKVKILDSKPIKVKQVFHEPLVK